MPPTPPPTPPPMPPPMPPPTPPPPTRRSSTSKKKKRGSSGSARQAPPPSAAELKKLKERREERRSSGSRSKSSSRKPSAADPTAVPTAVPTALPTADPTAEAAPRPPRSPPPPSAKPAAPKAPPQVRVQAPKRSVRALLRLGDEMMVRASANGSDSPWMTRRVSASKKRIFFSPALDEGAAIAATVHDLRASTAPFDDGGGVFVILVDGVAELSLLRGAEEEGGTEGEGEASVSFKADSATYRIKALRDDGATAEEWHRALLYLVGTRAAAKGGFDSPTKRSVPVESSPVRAAAPPAPVAASPPQTPTASEPDPTRAAWRPVVDPPTGRQYWHDENSMQSVWVLPPDAVEGAINFADDWVEQDHPETGRPFWFSPSLKKSVWVKPKLATNEQRALSPARSALVNDWVERVDSGTGRVFQYSPSLKKCVRARAALT